MPRPVIVPVSPAGFVITTTAGGHVIVDLVGWFTGRPRPTPPTGCSCRPRRPGSSTREPTRPRLWPDGTRELDVDFDAAAIATNVTIDRTDDSGFVTAYPAGTPLPTASTINAFGVNDTVANFAITPISNRGSAYFSDRGTDLIVDVTGYFTGTPMTATLPVPPNVQPPARALLVGDSTLAGVRWYGTTEALLGYPVRAHRRVVPAARHRVVPWARGLHPDQRGHRDPQRQRHVRDGRDHGRLRRLVDGVLEQLRPGGRRGPRQGRPEDRLADLPRGRRVRQSERRQRQRRRS